jgi:DDE superfamily endonuclease
MPTRVWLSLTAWLSDRTSVSCVAWAEALGTVSQDGLTRWLQADWSGHTRLELAWRTRFACERGSRIIDDTVLAKPCATAIEGLAWLYSSQERKPVYGLSLVRLVWTHGTRRVPVGIRLWRRGGASKYALALELLSDARHRLCCRPESVLCDAWYPSKALLKRLRGDGWDFVCRVKKTRRFKGHAVRPHRRHPYWAEVGWLSGGLKVLVVRHGKKY